MKLVSEGEIDGIHAAVQSIRPILAGRTPDLQGAILADLLAIWLAGHPDFSREEFLTKYIDLVRKLVPINEAMIFGEAGHPGNTKPS